MSEGPNELIRILSELFPNTFVFERWREHKPLKRGTREDLVTNGILTPEETRILRAYCSRRMYQQALAAGGDRYDLAGCICGRVDPEQAKAAAAWLAALDAANAKKAEQVRRDIKIARRNPASRVWKANPEPVRHPAPPQPQRLSLDGLKAAAQARKAANVGGAP